MSLSKGQVRTSVGAPAMEWLQQEADRRNVMLAELVRWALGVAFPEVAPLIRDAEGYTGPPDARVAPVWLKGTDPRTQFAGPARPDWVAGTDPVTGRPDPFAPGD